MPIGERGGEPSAKRRREVLQRTNLTKRPEGRRGSDLWPPWGGGKLASGRSRCNPQSSSGQRSESRYSNHACPKTMHMSTVDDTSNTKEGGRPCKVGDPAPKHIIYNRTPHNSSPKAGTSIRKCHALHGGTTTYPPGRADSGAATPNSK